MKLSVAAWATIGPRKVYELHDEKNRFYGYVSVNKLQEMGYVRRIDHYKKAEEFINSDAGFKWVHQNRFYNIA